MEEAWKSFIRRAEAIDQRVGPILNNCSFRQDDDLDEMATLAYGIEVFETSHTIVAPSPEMFEALKSLGPILRAVASDLRFGLLQIESPSGEILQAALVYPDRQELLSVLNKLDRILSEVVPLNERFVNAVAMPDVPTRTVDGFEMNRLEEVFYRLLKESNLLFSPQCKIVHQGRIINRFDFLVIYGGRAFRLEIDGYGPHTTREAHVKDRVSDRFYESRGVRVIRFAASEVHHDPDGCWRDLVDTLTGESGQEI